MSSRSNLLVTAATKQELKGALFPATPEFSPSVQGVGRAVYKGEDVYLLETGIGPVNAAFALGRFLGQEPDRVRGVLNVGVAGSFDVDQLGLRQSVIVQKEIWPEFGLWGVKGIDPRGLGLPLGRGASGPLWDELDLAPQEQALRMGCSLPREWPLVVSVTVAGVSGTPRRASTLGRRYRADIENMEGFALAWACIRSGVPFLECRTISNQVGSRAGWDLKGAVNALGGALSAVLGKARG